VRLSDRAEPLRRLLAGAWRERPPAPLASAADVGRAAEVALINDSAALAWWSLRGSPAGRLAAAAPLRAAYLRSHLQAAVNERLLAAVLRALAGRRIRAVVLKGWAMARLYPSPGLRTYHDIDLVVGRGDLAAARRARDELAPDQVADLHVDSDISLQRGWDELIARARPAPLEDVEALVLGPEDALRQACLHGLRHGFKRPVWLCDVALLMERLPAGLDWEYLCAGPPPMVSWLRHSLALAASLLAASTEALPRSLALPATPGWVRRSVLDDWARPLSGGELLRRLESRPWSVLAELRARWTPPLVTTHRHRLAVGTRPPTRLQVLDYLERGRSFVGRRWPGAGPAGAG